MNELKKRSMLALAAAMYVKEAPIIMELVNLNLDLDQGIDVKNRLGEIEEDLTIVIAEKIDSKELASLTLGAGTELN